MTYKYPKSDPANCHGHIISEGRNTVAYQYHGEARIATVLADRGPYVLVYDIEAGWLNLWRDEEET